MILSPLTKSLRAASAAGAALVLVAALNLSGAWAQSVPAVPSPDRAHIDELLKGLNRGRSVRQVAISPDGKQLAWIERAKEVEQIRVAPLNDLARRSPGLRTQRIWLSSPIAPSPVSRPISTLRGWTASRPGG
jgi:hypothetical protein